MSEKPLTAALKTQTQASQLSPVFFIEADFPSPTGTVRVCTLGGQYFKWNGEQWGGLGGVLTISPITDTTDLRAQSYKIGVNLLDGNWLDPTTLGDYNGKDCKIWFGAFDNSITENASLDTDPRLTLDPYLMIDGFLDNDEAELTGQGGNLEFTVIDKLEAMNRRSELRYTQEHQANMFPSSNDRGLENIPALQDKELRWGGR